MDEREPNGTKDAGARGKGAASLSDAAARDDAHVLAALVVAPLYLAVVALAVVLGKGRPPIGGLAALVAILVARAVLVRAGRAP